TEMAVMDNPTARDVMVAQTKGLRASPRGRASSPSPRSPSLTSPLVREVGSPQASPEGGKHRPHKPDLDEMGIALSHEVRPARPDSLPAEAQSAKAGPRSKLGRPGMRGGFKKRGR